MKLNEKQRLLADELEAYYSTYDSCEGELLSKIISLDEAEKGRSALYRKSLIHEYLAANTPIHIFRSTSVILSAPLGRSRYTWGGLQSRVGSYMQDSTAKLWRIPYMDALAEDRENGYMAGWDNPVGFDHHCPCYDTLLSEGIEGLITRAEKALESETDKRKREFYSAAVRSNKALLHLAERFSDLAGRLAESEEASSVCENYKCVQKIMARVPRYAPKTFREALTAIFFYRDVVGSLEGIGISTFGHLDRLLYPFYSADISAGILTREEAKRLISDLLIYTEVRFNTAELFRETSTTIELGGADADGATVFNEVTRILLEAVLELRTIGTKINCRISNAHSDEYLSMISRIQLSGVPTVMMHNDDVLIPSRTAQGQDVRDARLYLGCGCHEILLAGTEVCTRADTWVNPARVFLDTLKKNEDAKTFEEIYARFTEDMQAYYNRIVSLKNEGESHWYEFAPLPLISSAIVGCLEKGMDLTEGGAKYNTTSISLVGAATLVDSLYAVKDLVYDTGRLTLSELNNILELDYNGYEPLRNYIINKIPKHGSNDPDIAEFSAKVLSDLSSVAGQTNARGGKYLPAFYPHDCHRRLGLNSGATPDGRHKGVSLSRGVSPSEFVSGITPTDFISSLASIDFTKYAESFIADITLPPLPNDENGEKILLSLIRSFLDAKGSSLQFNTLSIEELLEARADPKNHRNIYVRVCGYSADFITLSEQTQDEIIQRAVRSL